MVLSAYVGIKFSTRPNRQKTHRELQGSMCYYIYHPHYFLRVSSYHGTCPQNMGELSWRWAALPTLLRMRGIHFMKPRSQVGAMGNFELDKTVSLKKPTYKKGYPMYHPNHHYQVLERPVTDCEALPNPMRRWAYKWEVGYSSQSVLRTCYTSGSSRTSVEIES